VLQAGRKEIESLVRQASKSSEESAIDLGRLVRATRDELNGSQGGKSLEVLEMENLLAAYWKVAAKRFIDHVPEEFEARVVEKFKTALRGTIDCVSDADLEKIVFRDSSVVENRNRLEAKLGRVNTALKEISRNSFH